jgi:phosphopantothenoylcysteine decarboxylase/phosphopantothenate--cysteine ligase
VLVVAPAVGRLAGGDVGAGRLAEPEDIVAAAEQALTPPDLAGLQVLVTAGGTREPIDAVRVITNRSSGKQGYAVAAEAARRGAKVTLVSTIGRPADAAVDLVAVETASEMADAVFVRADQADVVVMAAAVADFRPVTPAAGKLKKDTGLPEIVLEPTTDILAELGRRKRPGQVLVGFAAETDDVAANARGKLQRKHLDLIVANDVSAPGVGFEHDTNAVTILGTGGVVQNVPLADKRVIASAVLDAVIALIRPQPSTPTPSSTQTTPQEHP